MMTDKARLVVVGGFLGAGKTTALARLARSFHDEGGRVGLITNDQAADLVDTGVLRVQGFRVEEVAGACFCCKFDDLSQAVERIRRELRPNLLLAEPVGSCTDLAATVVAPFRKLYGDRYSVAPYSVLVDPSRARQILIDRGFGGFSPKVAYIFQKQLEEADVICANKCDQLSPEQRRELRDALSREFPAAKVLFTSGLTGEGFDEWREEIGDDAPSGRNIADVDYDLYAEGEAELGWLNMALDLGADVPFDGNALVKDLATRITERLAAERAEVAHLKILLEKDGAAAVANSVGAGSLASPSRTLPKPVGAGALVVNARVAADPERIRALVEAALAEVLPRYGVSSVLTRAAQFRPGRPMPAHRFARGQV